MHKPNSRKAQVHAAFDKGGVDAALKLGIKLGLKEGSVKSWIGSWAPRVPKPKKEKPETPVSVVVTGPTIESITGLSPSQIADVKLDFKRRYPFLKPEELEPAIIATVRGTLPTPPAPPAPVAQTSKRKVNAKVTKELQRVLNAAPPGTMPELPTFLRRG